MAGAWPAVFSMSITPFTADGRLDEGLLREHLRFMAEGGVGVYLCSQGSGEGDLLTAEEKLRIYEIGVEEIKDRTSVHAAGIGLGHRTEDVAALARGAQDRGVDAVYILGPRPGPVPLRVAEVEAYYREVIGAVSCPVVIANNVSLAAHSMPPDLIERLVRDFDHVKGVLIADAAGPLLNQVARFAQSIGDRVEIRIGVIPLALTAFALGADGLLCFEPNIAPRTAASVFEAAKAGDGAALLARYRKIMQLNLICSKYGNPRSLKEAMEVVGLGPGLLRKPYQRLTAEERADMEAVLKDIDLGAVEAYPS
jgi:4-hydroxy-tetrahydrodipicolinate synthase